MLGLEFGPRHKLGPGQDWNNALKCLSHISNLMLHWKIGQIQEKEDSDEERHRQIHLVSILSSRIRKTGRHHTDQLTKTLAANSVLFYNLAKRKDAALSAKLFILTEGLGKQKTNQSCYDLTLYVLSWIIN